MMPDAQDQSEVKGYGIVVRRRPALLLEGLAVGGVFLVLPILFSFLYLHFHRSDWVPLNDAIENAVYIVDGLVYIGLLLFVQWMSGDDFASFGYVKLKPIRDVAMFAVAFLPIYYFYSIGVNSLDPVDRDAIDQYKAVYGPQHWLAVSTAIARIFSQ